MSYVPPPTPNAAPVHEPIPNHLAWAIVSTVLSFLVCCVACLSFPGIVTGIVAIVFSTKVNSLLRAGDIDGARRASASAKIWCWVTTAILIVAVLISAIWFISVGPDGYMEAMQEFQRQLEQQQSQ